MFQRGRPNRINPTDISMQVLTPMEEVLANGIIQDNQKLVQKQQLEQDYFTAYKPAIFQKALKFKKDHSYQ